MTLYSRVVIISLKFLQLFLFQLKMSFSNIVRRCIQSPVSIKCGFLKFHKIYYKIVKQILTFPCCMIYPTIPHSQLKDRPHRLFNRALFYISEKSYYKCRVLGYVQPSFERNYTYSYNNKK